MEDIINGIRTLKKQFDECAKVEGDKNTLTKNEVKLLLQKELGVTSHADVEYFYNQLDDDKDKVVTFSECLDFVFEIGKILAN